MKEGCHVGNLGLARWADNRRSASAQALKLHLALFLGFERQTTVVCTNVTAYHHGQVLLWQLSQGYRSDHSDTMQATRTYTVRSTKYHESCTRPCTTENSAHTVFVLRAGFRILHWSVCTVQILTKRVTVRPCSEAEAPAERQMSQKDDRAGNRSQTTENSIRKPRGNELWGCVNLMRRAKRDFKDPFPVHVSPCIIQERNSTVESLPRSSGGH